MASDATENLINLMSTEQNIDIIAKCDEAVARQVIENDSDVKELKFEQPEEDDTVKLELDEFTEEEVDLQNFIENHIKEGNNYHTWNVSREFDNLLEK